MRGSDRPQPLLLLLDHLCDVAVLDDGVLGDRLAHHFRGDEFLNLLAELPLMRHIDGQLGLIGALSLSVTPLLHLVVAKVRDWHYLERNILAVQRADHAFVMDASLAAGSLFAPVETLLRIDFELAAALGAGYICLSVSRVPVPRTPSLIGLSVARIVTLHAEVHGAELILVTDGALLEGQVLVLEHDLFTLPVMGLPDDPLDGALPGPRHLRLLRRKRQRLWLLRHQCLYVETRHKTHWIGFCSELLYNCHRRLEDSP